MPTKLTSGLGHLEQRFHEGEPHSFKICDPICPGIMPGDTFGFMLKNIRNMDGGS